MPPQGDPSERATIGTLLSLVTHDLRNPLSVLLTNLGYLDSVLAQGDIAEARTVLADLGMACDALARYLSNLDLLGADLAVRPLSPSRTTVHALLSTAIQRAAVAFEQQDVGTTLVIADDCPDLLLDAELAIRGIENILANAAVFAPRGSNVTLEAKNLRGERVRISVSDDGPSLPTEHRQLAFRADGQETMHRDASSRYGRGLGLLAAGIAARRLGGTIHAPVVATGCRFDVELPVGPPESIFLIISNA